MVHRVVIHAGFHKTGTTTIQKTLRENKTLLHPSLRIILRDGMVGLCEAARAYSVSKGAWDLGMVAFETAEIMQKFTDFEGDLLLSSEDLSGHMPGRRGLKSYRAAPKILTTIYGVTTEIFPKADVSFVFGTRAPKAWLNSCYVQHLRATRITQSAQEYAIAYKGSARLEKVVEEVRARLPDVNISASKLEDAQDQIFGPLNPILDHLNISQSIRDQLVILPPANTAPPQEKLDKLLELNRSNLSDDALKVAKRALNKLVF